MLELSRRQMEAAQEFATATVSALRLAEGVHPPTIVAATARMAGTYLFRSFGLRLRGVRPGAAVLSEAASERAPDLIQIAAGALARLGIGIATSPPAPGAGPRIEPMQGFLETQRKLEVAYAPIRAKYGFSAQEAAYAVAAATALLIRHCSRHLDPNVAFGLAAYGFVEGSKTAPDPVEPV
jgi:hypothetical protein